MSKKTLAINALPQAVQGSLAALGLRIRRARKRRGLTIVELARCMYASSVTVRKVERGDPTVSLGVLAAALSCLNMGLEFDKVARFEDDETGALLDMERLDGRKRVRRKTDDGLNF
jgi:transcriptional regulator with XRE-family HTH domain